MPTRVRSLIRPPERNPGRRERKLRAQTDQTGFCASRHGVVYLRLTKFSTADGFKGGYISYHHKREAYTEDEVDENGRKKHKQRKDKGKKRNKKHKTHKKRGPPKTMCSRCFCPGKHKGWCSKKKGRTRVPYKHFL